MRSSAAGFLTLALSISVAQAAVVSMPQSAVRPISLETDKGTSLPDAAPDLWDCILGAWVRAPDLSPNAVVQGDARLTLNGTACVDVQGWDLGLRLKERAIARLRAQGVDFPVKPERNMTRGVLNRMDNIFEVGHNSLRFGFGGDEYAQALANYSEQMKNKSLWEVYGVERSVFDIVLPMASVSENSSLPNATVKSFSLHVPNTNFPPSRSQNFWMSSNERELDFSCAETMFEYYFKISLKNGSTLDYPAGRTAFLPGGTEKTLSVKTEVEVPEMTAPVWRESQRAEGYGQKETCDNGWNSTFSVRFNDLPTEFIQGEIVPLNVTITRTGNGSEFPSFLVLHDGSQTKPTWALSKATTDEQKEALFHRSTTRWFGTFGSLLRAQPHQPRKIEEDLGAIIMWGDDGKKGGLNLTQVDIQHVIYNLNITNITLPTFSHTFVDFLSLLHVELYTRYYCAFESATVLYDGSKPSSNEEEAVIDLNNDDNWKESPPWPTTVKKAGAIVSSSEFQHNGNVSITIVMPYNEDPNLSPPTHYTSPDAQTPVLASVPETSPHFFGRVNTIWNLLDTESNGEELKKGAYDAWNRLPHGVTGEKERRMGRFVGGAMQYVGEVWEEKLMRERVKAERSEKFRLQEVTKDRADNKFVVQD